MFYVADLTSSNFKIFIFATAGNIVLKSKLDRETTDSYHLIIQASDGGTPSKNTTTMVCM